MRDPHSRVFSGKDESANFGSEDSWLNRVRENIGQLLIPTHLKPTSANGAPIHLLKFEKSPRPARAQGASLISHAAIFGGLLFLLTHGPRTVPPPTGSGAVLHLPPDMPLPVFPSLRSEQASSGRGSGGEQTPTPQTHGNLPPLSSIVLVKPTIPEEQHPNLPEPPTIFDPGAASVLTPGEKIGLPWMPQDTNSAGPGKRHGIGSGDDGTLGDGGPGPAGYGTSNNPYAPGVTAPGCAFCPYPTYTDDARHSKVEGSVTLEVLVGADGRAETIRVVKGIGFGLDERALETVRSWKFIPARDGSHRPVAAWVTVEAVFRLF